MIKPLAFPQSESSAFWSAYMGWQSVAKEDELRQLEAALASLQSQEVISIERAVRLALREEGTASALPQTLVRRLEAMHGEQGELHA